ncbi:putative ubiquitin-protein ligase sel1 protein [Golovinomyces cichoracearum]|uniref:Putative ubiquitin-protein ligase sel1 protein n=1 Tax=Golovinomyces cichoracearum TaxID=62708 RepID=A0A420IL68_9PEZI|nr:putative ubiquitin-protein ligase sel1 protein [Golovinomyces cichoracearum]
MASYVKRQFGGEDFYIVEREPSFWWTKTGQIVRWSIFLGLFTLLMAYISIGYFHAKRRMKKGLPLLAYHRWLVNENSRAQYDPNYRNQSSYYYQYAPQVQNGYGMQAMPPPMYNPNAPLPPSYQSPLGGTKSENSQWRPDETGRPENVDNAPGYLPPPGPRPQVAHQK